jgi:outer membrane protein TolC
MNVPDMTVTDSLYRQPVVAEDTASIASLSWKELFTDPQLQQLIETGIANNNDLNIARLKGKKQKHYCFLPSWLICLLYRSLRKEH